MRDRQAFDSESLAPVKRFAWAPDDTAHPIVWRTFSRYSLRRYRPVLLNRRLQLIWNRFLPSAYRIFRQAIESEQDAGPELQAHGARGLAEQRENLRETALGQEPDSRRDGRRTRRIPARQVARPARCGAHTTEQRQSDRGHALALFIKAAIAAFLFSIARMPRGIPIFLNSGNRAIGRH
ncbi:hypothetical protein [Burkholderia gladioli]|uniref:hypothetical protein n=1 Tax=Burkholderia gladioli TaxID=28095 RepID=UPI001640F409|nr:hypothetical protein [Burkholderia gladioli]